MADSPRLAKLMAMDPDKRRKRLATMPEEERREFQWHWQLWARQEQLPPADDWRAWLIMAGRGFGKTRAGAEWVRAVAEAQGDARIALVAASLNEARSVMVEGECGLLAIAPPGCTPVFEPSLRRISWPSGAQATFYSAGEPEALRGPQHSHARGPSAEGGLPQRSSCPDRRLVARCGSG
jgi:phage terminase large subunit-like protein